MSATDHSPLGRNVPWPHAPDASLLCPIPRRHGRDALGLPAAGLPFVGHDDWTAYELSWLDPRGKPQVAIARLRVPAGSPHLLESKSLKLYLGGFAMAKLASAEVLRTTLAADLSAAAGAPITVDLLPAVEALPVRELPGHCVDALPVAIDDYGPPRPDLLQPAGDGSEVDETLVSHLFRSNCPVTGQPDWASVQVRYQGPRIDPAGVLRYLTSFRRYSGFHEQCVERIFVELLAQCRPAALSVLARFTRRGGIDINPWRATPGMAPPPPVRTARQ